MVNLHTLAFAVAAGLLCQASAGRIQRPPVASHRRSDTLQGNCTSSGYGAQIPITGSQPPASDKGNWLGWGADVYNNRWAASDAVLDSSNIENLALACSANYTTGLSSAPLVEDGIAYYPTWGGLLVALEYATCTTIWSINITSIITDFKPVTQGVVSPQARSTPVVDGDVLYIGTLAQSLLLAINKQSGAVIDTLQIDSHPYAILTQSPTFYNGLLYIGTSSDEEAAAAEVPQYECCSHVGSMNAVAFQNNRLSLVWTTSMIPSGSGFSGASIWGSQPAIDPIREQVFVATGNSYDLPADFQACQNQTANITVIQQGFTHDPCLPRNVWQESVLALDLATGRVNWVRQLGKLDAWNYACQPGVVPGGGNPSNCPSHPGPDEDFGMAPTFVPGSKYTPDGLDIVVVGQKNGNLYALTAQAGMLMWTLVTMPEGNEGGFIWGIAVDDQNIYFTNTNSGAAPVKLLDGTTITNSAFGAASLKDGNILWLTAAATNQTSVVPPTLVNDVVLVGTTGHLSDTGHVVGPGFLTPLNKHTGEVLRVITLDAFFGGNSAAVHEYILFGTGYGGSRPSVAGSFQVWKVTS